MKLINSLYFILIINIRVILYNIVSEDKRSFAYVDFYFHVILSIFKWNFEIINILYDSLSYELNLHKSQYKKHFEIHV